MTIKTKSAITIFLSSLLVHFPTEGFAPSSAIKTSHQLHKTVIRSSSQLEEKTKNANSNFHLTDDEANRWNKMNDNSRRSFLGDIATSSLGALSFGTLFSPRYAKAAVGDDTLTDVYFGVGCFWHIQHEFVIAEKKLLGRKNTELTSRTGYAGGTSTDKEGRVCYHNFSGIADYGKLGHGEVVGMTIPESSIGDFAKEYFSLFTSKGERVDPMDRGGEYRSLLGLPGGISHPSYQAVEAAANAKGMTLALGKGNDPDTLGTKMVYVYDSTKFPFYQAEVYHQFHNDFQSPAYGNVYNELANVAFLDGRVKRTGCPDRL